MSGPLSSSSQCSRQTPDSPRQDKLEDEFEDFGGKTSLFPLLKNHILFSYDSSALIEICISRKDIGRCPRFGSALNNSSRSLKSFCASIILLPQIIDCS